MHAVRTKIARGGFSVIFTTDTDCRAVVHYFASGTGGRQTTGTVTLEGASEKFVAVDFPVLAAGVTDLEIHDTGKIASGASHRAAAAAAPAIVSLVVSTILAAGGMAGGAAHAATHDQSRGWRNADLAVYAPAGSLASTHEPFVASG